MLTMTDTLSVRDIVGLVGFVQITLGAGWLAVSLTQKVITQHLMEYSNDTNNRLV